MNPEELFAKLHAEPFEWFTIHLTDGTAYEIRHPESLMLGKGSATVGVKDNPSQHYYDRMVTVSLLHVVRLEPAERQMPATAPSVDTAFPATIARDEL